MPFIACWQHYNISFTVWKSLQLNRAVHRCALAITYLSTRFPHAALLLPYDPCHWDCITGGTIGDNQ